MIAPRELRIEFSRSAIGTNRGPWLAEKQEAEKQDGRK